MTSQFVYFLKLQPEFQNFSAWTAREHEIVDRHFLKLKSLVEDGVVALAGRTTAENPTGIVVFHAETEAQARALMMADPAIEEGLMSAELHPFHIALQRASQL